MARVGCDIDGILRNWADQVMKVVENNEPELILEDTVRDWDFQNCLDMPLTDFKDFAFNIYAEEIYLDAAPYPGAIGHFNLLTAWAKERGHKLVCVSHQFDNTIDYTTQWLGEHGFAFKELHFTASKTKIPLNYLIDDGPIYLKEWNDAGRDPSKFLMFTRPWNENEKPVTRVRSLLEAIKVINKLEGDEEYESVVAELKHAD